MLPHYSPLKVAESFSMLAALWRTPEGCGRIDLGIGRAPGTSAPVALRLQRDRRLPAPDDFRDQLGELLGYFSSRPSMTAAPEPRPLDSGSGRRRGSAIPQSRRLARQGPPGIRSGGNRIRRARSADGRAARGAARNRWCFADFINPAGAPIAAYYREGFTPSAWQSEPHTAVAVWAICAPTDDEALHLSASFRMMMLQL